MRRLSQDICDDTYVCNQSTRLYAWVEYYRGLLNVEFPRERDTLSDAPPVEDSALGITNNMVHAALNKKKICGKAAGKGIMPVPDALVIRRFVP